jgi:hypothetical protein
MSPAAKAMKLFGAVLVAGVFAFRTPTAIQVEYTPYREARPILEAMGEIIPPELSNAPAEHREEAWNAWARKRDAKIRERLAQGDADSVVNLLLFGTSFTSAPRLTIEQLRSISGPNRQGEEVQAAAAWQALLEKRVQDLVRGMAAPGSNERLQFARKTLERAGTAFSAANEQKAYTYLYENVKRVSDEQAGFQQTLQMAKSLNNPAEEFIERSKLYKQRGLSLDTSLPPDYALEVALREMKKRGLLKPESIKRVGIIGPGLDFTDKQEGFDFYPTQTLQPFAFMDSLLRLGLAKADELEVDPLDLSPRVLGHVQRAKRAAEKGGGYKIELPEDPAWAWRPELVAYWRQFGDHIGVATAPAAVPPALAGITLRAIRVNPRFIRRMKNFDVNIILQRANLPEDAKFDLLVATNILVYYDTFEQSLAMANIAAMLKPQGFLLTNNALLELPFGEMRSGGYQTVVYSQRADDGDHMIWYQRKGQGNGGDLTH